MSLNKFFAASLILFGAAAAFAGGVFELKENGKSYTLDFNGKPLIVSEGFMPGFVPEKTLAEKSGNDLILSAWGNSHNIKWRREAATVENGKEVELTFQAMIPAFNEDHYKGEILRYFEIPKSVLDGCEYTALVGGHKRNKYVKGVLKTKGKDRLLMGGSVRCIAFKKGDFKLVVDFAPSGVQDLYSSYTIGSLSGFGSLHTFGDKVRFYMGTKSSRNGGIHTGKIVLYSGTEKDFELRHARDKYGYCSEMEAEKRFVFGADKIGKGKIRAQLLPYTVKRSYGWVNNGGAVLEKFRPQGTLYAAAAGKDNAVFQADLKRQGLYIVNINIGTGNAPVDGMNLTLNGKELVKGLKIAPQTAQKIQIPMWIENNKAVFEFSGNWRVSEIAFQLLLASKEDLSIRRPLWLSKNTDYPSPFYHNEHYAQEPVYKVHLSNFPLPEPGKEAVGKARMNPWTTAYGDMSAYKEKIFSAMIGSWGTGNSGVFCEFSAPGAVERNIRELQQNKIDIVMFNGMLARHTFAEPHKKRLHNVIGNYVKTARQIKKDFIFIDHIDYSMLWNSDSGFRRLISWNDRLQETIDGGLPGRARCMTNPKAVNEFYDTVIEHIRQTGIDGLMVDECLFMTTEFCGCASCRKFFAEDTGYQLPADELSKDLNNPKSTLWRTWQEWRRRKIGEFWLNLRKKVSEYRKDFIFIGYTTEYGLTGAWAPNDMGSDIFNYARSWDMIGTEIMPRNIFACARGINSTRKAFSFFNRTGNTPVFGLVYASDWKVKYFGWAMNNLNAQQTWETRFVACPEGEVNFRTFTVDKGNMDLLKAKSAAKVALLFSETSRNMAGSFPAAGAYRRELFGTAQMLEKLHIDYDMISDVDLNSKKLAGYSVLMLGNSSYLSDKYISEIMKFMENGGVVSASYMAGVCDESGKLRSNDLAGKILGWKASPKGPAGAEIAAVTLDGKEQFKPLRSVAFRRMPNLPVGDTDAAFISKANRKLPAVVRKKVGKGWFVYMPGMYGSGNCSNYVMVGQKYNFVPDYNLEKFQKKLLNDLLKDHRVWQVENLPEDVFTAAYTQENKFVVHFLNAVNSMPEAGTVVGYYLDKTAFPKLESFSFTVPFKVKNAYIVSPEFEGKKSLKAEYKNSVSKITVPAGAFKVYSLIYLEK